MKKLTHRGFRRLDRMISGHLFLQFAVFIAGATVVFLALSGLSLVLWRPADNVTSFKASNRHCAASIYVEGL
jgi:hypothetical protein